MFILFFFVSLLVFVHRLLTIPSGGDETAAEAFGAHPPFRGNGRREGTAVDREERAFGKQAKRGRRQAEKGYGGKPP